MKPPTDEVLNRQHFMQSQKPFLDLLKPILIYFLHPLPVDYSVPMAKGTKIRRSPTVTRLCRSLNLYAMRGTLLCFEGLNAMLCKIAVPPFYITLGEFGQSKLAISPLTAEKLPE